MMPTVKKKRISISDKEIICNNHPEVLESIRRNKDKLARIEGENIFIIAVVLAILILVIERIM